MKVLFDTNVIHDLLLDREPWSALATELVAQVERGGSFSAWHSRMPWRTFSLERECRPLSIHGHEGVFVVGRVVGVPELRDFVKGRGFIGQRITSFFWLNKRSLRLGHVTAEIGIATPTIATITAVSPELHRQLRP